VQQVRGGTLEGLGSILRTLVSILGQMGGPARVLGGAKQSDFLCNKTTLAAGKNKLYTARPAADKLAYKG
jgi:hypothetical protein